MFTIIYTITYQYFVVIIQTARSLNQIEPNKLGLWFLNYKNIIYEPNRKRLIVRFENQNSY